RRQVPIHRQRGAEALGAGPGVVAELRRAGRRRPPGAVVVELQADRRAAALLPGEAQVAVLAGARVLADLHPEARQRRREALVRRHLETLAARELVRRL